jgi:hypothetical protein
MGVDGHEHASGCAHDEVQHPFVGAVEAVVEEADQRVVEPCRVLTRALVERLEAVDRRVATPIDRPGFS